MSRQRLIVVEDEAPLRDLYARALEQAGYQVRTAGGAQACRHLLREGPADCLLLDIGLPDLDGLSLAAEFTDTPDLGLIIVSRRDAPEDRIAALELGCDDYITKPVHLGELCARVMAVLRRRSPRRKLALGPFRMDLEAHALSADGADIPLTRGEFAILALLVAAGGKVVAREALFERISRKPDDGDLRTVDILVSRIRRKTAETAGGERLIVTAPGFGYRTGLEAVEC
ncbi:response regulator transcription factor [Caulobacter sp. NIBR1757]|uniref:response regulator transcription factor n=1 Tax=Caulobacter sp. NIBR1757 TaxID=3016000 RepID=UPI0022F08FE7|nr:response regulator transcription factor [Caulobacter sp. NIBR1757]WGM40080.1 Transcriptional regulatory protein PhoP [Caulobacter sp. NIBR1757]